MADIKGSFAYNQAERAKNALGSVPFKENDDKNWQYVGDEETKLGELKTALESLKSNADNSTGESESNGKNKQWVGSTIGAVVGGVGGGILLNKITGDIQESMRDADAKAAYEEFMNQIGRHIYCYIGGEEAGTYGEMVQPYVE